MTILLLFQLLISLVLSISLLLLLAWFVYKTWMFWAIGGTIIVVIAIVIDIILPRVLNNGRSK